MGKEGEQHFGGNFIQRTIKHFLRKAKLNYEIVGVENLTGINPETGEEKPYNLKALLDQGETATAVPNHPAYADFPTGAAIVAKEGLEEFMGALVASKRYTNSPLIGPPFRVIAYALDIELQSVNPHKYGGDKENQKMNAKAEKKVRTSRVGIAVLEGGHSPEMQSARWGSVRWWEGKSYIVPVAFRGTENQWPGGIFKLLYYLRKGRKEHKATLIIGEPVPVSYMERVAEVYAQGDPDPNALRRFRVDFPNLLIANLHKEHVRSRGLEENPEETKYTKGYYDDLSQRLSEHPVSVSLQELRNLGEVRSRQTEQPQEAVEDRNIKPKPILRFKPGTI